MGGEDLSRVVARCLIALVADLERRLDKDQRPVRAELCNQHRVAWDPLQSANMSAPDLNLLQALDGVTVRKDGVP